MMLKRMLSRKWILATLLVIAGAAVMIRLGIWQLDRLEQRRAFNARVSAQLEQPALVLNGEAPQGDLAQMEYRAVSVQGEYLIDEEIALRNQYWDNQWGVHLVTPLRIAGSQQAVLVDRGWIPGAEYESSDWSQFAEPGLVTVQGVIRGSMDRAQLGSRSDPTPVPGTGPLKTWNFVNIPRIGEQVSIPLLPVYIQQASQAGYTGLPQRTQPELDLSEGPHMGYALQWFTFAAILVFGYPVFILRREKEEKRSSLQRGREEMKNAEVAG
jgi:surfeit locus 1 family protein